MKIQRIARSRPLAIAIAVASMSLLGVAHAGAHQHPHEEPFERMVQRLELEDDQEPAVREILADSRTRMQEIRRSGDRERRSAMEALREDTQARLSEVLTPAQMQAMADARGERREVFRGKMEDRREARFAELAEALELADSQIVPVQEILEDAQQSRRAAMAAARNEGGDRAGARAARAAMKQIDADIDGRLSAVLTPAQMETFESLREERGAQRPRRPHGPRAPRSAGRDDSGSR